MGDEITTRDATKIFLRKTDKSFTFQLRVFTFRVVELEDLHFNLDSAVLLPDFQNPATDDGTPQKRITSLAILATVLKHAKDNPTRKLLLAAHADTLGATGYNVTLSEKRGENVLAVLTGDEAKWVSVCKAKHKTEDIQMILKWMARDWGWNCDPGTVDNQMGEQTRRAVANFQVRYNNTYSADLPHAGVVEDKTWGAFFKLYQEELTEVADTDAAGLTALRTGLKWVNAGKKSVGCGESFPIDQPKRDEYRSANNRRVEICFFDDKEEPLLDCHPGAGQCVPKKCEIYNPRMYAPEIIPVEPILPRVVRCRVHLELSWKDPAGTAHFFPKDLPFKILYNDDTTDEKTVGEAGQLYFIADKRKERFTLKYDLADARYVASGADSGGASIEQFLAEADAEREVKDHQFRIWKLPKTWVLGETMVEITHAQWSDPWFRTGDDIATSDAPVKALVKPAWQFVRFEYFDRHFGQANHSNKRIAPPALFLEALTTAPATEADERDQEADTRSNWTVSDDDPQQTAQALPWLKQRMENGSGDPNAKPDEKILLRLKHEPGTYVVAESAAVRKLDKPAADKLAPGPDRLKYYDLPELWLSAGYYARLPGPPANSGKFWGSLTRADVHNSTAPAKKLVFSLDDLVLYDGSGTTPLTATQFPVIFHHAFDNTAPGASDFTLSRYGIYKPGPYDGTQAYYPYSNVDLSPVRYYIRDYPNWVRLVAAQGNLYDVFAERSKRDAMGTPSGARAARRWYDAVNGPNTGTPGNPVHPRPARTDQPFFSIQPFYRNEESLIRNQDQPAGRWLEWSGTPYPNQANWGNGRLDMTLLRNCGVKNGREQAINLHYFRFFFDYTAPPASLNTAAKRAKFTKDTVDNIAKRWNGPDSTYSGDPAAVLKPVDPVANKLDVLPRWFLQELPVAQAHYRIQVTTIARAWMLDFDGTAQYSDDSSAPYTTPASMLGWFTAAHECGHGDGLPDDYGEEWNHRACSYGLPGFAHNTTADAYSLLPDNLAMMLKNREPHPRYFWHAAEWVRDITKVPLQVEQGARRKWRMAAHPSAPRRTYATWPIWRDVGQAFALGTNSRGQFDTYVYSLGDASAGDDPYRDGLVSGKTFDGLAIVIVKMRFAFPNATQASDITNVLTPLYDGIKSHFNFKFECSGDVGPFKLNHCLIHFSPRFLVETLTPDWDYYLSGLSLAPAFPTTTPPFANAAARTAWFNSVIGPPNNYSTKVNAIDSISAYPRHFMISVDTAGPTAWTGTTGLHYNAPANPETDFYKYFGDMLGLGMSSGGALTLARLQTLIVSQFMTNINMANV